MLLENVKNLCKKHHITLAELERQVGIGNGVIAKWRDRSPRIDTVKKVADYFGTTVDFLMAREETEV